jgi:hypothetical protein
VHSHADSEGRFRYEVSAYRESAGRHHRVQLMEQLRQVGGNEQHDRRQAFGTRLGGRTGPDGKRHEQMFQCAAFGLPCAGTLLNLSDLAQR